MMPAKVSEIVDCARAAGRSVGAFNIIGIEHAEAIVAGAEAARAPVVLQIGENCVAYHGAAGADRPGLPRDRTFGRRAGHGAPGSRHQD